MFDETEVVDQVEVDDVFDTGSVAIPIPPAEAHLGTIEGVTSVTFDSGATAIEIALKASDTPGLDSNLRVFVPKLFVADIFVDKASLPEEEGNNQLFAYRTGIANDKQEATIQKLLVIAKENGRTSSGLGLTKPTTFDEYVLNLGAMLVGLEIIFVRRPGKGDYAHRLETKQIYPRSAADNPKMLKKVIKAWEI